jgi:hypothetical protein
MRGTSARLEPSSADSISRPLSSFERSKAEQVLYTIAYEEERFEDAREHVRRSIDAGVCRR